MSKRIFEQKGGIFRKFRWKVLIILCYFALIPLLVAGGIGYFFARSILIKTAQDFLYNLTINSAERILNWFDDKGKDCELLAQSPVLTENFEILQTTKPEQLDFILARQNILERLNFFLKTQKDIDEVLISDARDGKILVATLFEKEGDIISDESHFQEALKGKTTFTTITPSQIAIPNEKGVLEEGMPTLFVSTPLEKRGKVLGVLSIRLKHQALNQITKSIITRPASFISLDQYLINSDGFMASEPTRVDDLKKMGLITRRATLELKVVDPGFDIFKKRASSINSLGPTFAVSQCLEGKKGVSQRPYRDYKGEEVFGAWQWLEKFNLGVITEVKKSEVFSILNDYIEITSLIVLCAILLSGIYSYIVSYRLSNPLEKLVKTMEEVSRGNLNQNITIRAKDEFGRLGDAFNQMIDRLKQSRKELEIKSQELIQVNEELKSLSIKLEKAKNSLEQKVKERTYQLEKANEELDSFVYIASHDLKEPLRIIDAFSSLLQRDYGNVLDQKAEKYLDRIRANVELMKALIDSLLTLSRISRVIAPFEKVSLKEILDTVIERFQDVIKEKNVKLILPPNLPHLFCDRTKMVEVFANLISNAIKFNDKSDPWVKITYNESNGMQIFSVEDNGIGIAQKDLDKIFMPFQRLNPRDKYEGSGIGLNIVKRIIEFHHGKIWVKSEPEKGTTFSFAIPKPHK